MKNSADLGGCYPPQPSASVDNTLLDLQNSSYPTQPHSIIAKYMFPRQIETNAFRVKSNTDALRQHNVCRVCIEPLCIFYCRNWRGFCRSLLFLTSQGIPSGWTCWGGRDKKIKMSVLVAIFLTLTFDECNGLAHWAKQNNIFISEHSTRKNLNCLYETHTFF